MQSGWSRKHLQQAWSRAIADELDQVAAFNPLPNQAPPEELPAFQAVHWEVGAMGVDLRPHIFDPVMKKWLLCDSGSQISAIPPEQGDKAIKGQFLKAVNGTKIQCYGTKEIFIKIGRKEYKFTFIKADVSTPVIGWDFFKAHRLDFRWNDWGDITLYDAKAKISTILNYKSLPFEESLSIKRLRKTEEVGPTRSRVIPGAKPNRNLAQEVAAIKALDNEDYSGKEDIEK